MSYSTNYTDEYGHTREVSITEEDSAEALKNDYQEIVRKYNPRYVTIQRVQAKTGETMHLKVTVKAPSHYLTTNEDSAPKACESMTADIICYPGYPLKSVSASYASDHYLASPNVFRSGNACIDTWIPFTSSLTTVVDKLVRDMIHDPSVTRYESTAPDTSPNRNLLISTGATSKISPSADATIPTNIPPTTIATTPNTPGRPSVHRSALCSAASINPLSSASPIIRGDAACSRC